MNKKTEGKSYKVVTNYRMLLVNHCSNKVFSTPNIEWEWKLDSRKSDVDAKKAYSEYLKSKNFKNIKVISSPSDISAEKNGEVFYFEIKKPVIKKNILVLPHSPSG